MICVWGLRVFIHGAMFYDECARQRLAVRCSLVVESSSFSSTGILLPSLTTKGLILAWLLFLVAF